jgi:group II intron reverse transcriptase/maturase
MMNEPEKSDPSTVAAKHVTVDLLRTAYLKLKRDAAPGVDGTTWREYGHDLEAKLVDLHGRVHRGAYRALPSRRKFIQKEDGRERPLGIAALEDKIVQRARGGGAQCDLRARLSWLFIRIRPRRGQHDALDALAVGITYTKVSWIVDADVRSFFDSTSHEWLIRFAEHRIGDPRMIRLIRKWLKAGVMDGAEWTSSDIGSPQGAVVSPTLANIYLHYTFDLWADRWRRHHARGNVVIVRYADDTVAGFEYETDAKRFLADLRERLEKFALSLHPDKTRLIEFGRFAAERRVRRGLGKPETFNFLGFTHICGHSRAGYFLLKRKTRRDRMRVRLRAIKEELRRRMHEPIPEQGRWLGQVLRGYFAYHAVPTNTRSLCAFRHHVTNLWRRSLRRRSQRDRTTWDRAAQLVAAFLPAVRIIHPWPHERFAVNHPM